MTAEIAMEYIDDGGIVAGMRGPFVPDVALKVCNVLLDEDIDVFEFTLNSEDALEAMQTVKKTFGDEVCVGMGTVLNVDAAQRVLDAGADFIVSPALQPDVVEFVMKQDTLIAPGVITPSEAVAAWGMGVRLLKLFPIGALGVDYFKAMFGPLNHMQFMCNGAMNADNAHDFIKAGALAAGMSGWLTGDGTWTDSKLRSRARVLVNGVRKAQGTQTD
jgi:2-dehydro-3-deoxyphosphogluconate aldolase/(4S)-4-hydroxy-2-oxoglutarate aldolase